MSFKLELLWLKVSSDFFRNWIWSWSRLLLLVTGIVDQRSDCIFCVFSSFCSLILIYSVCTRYASPCWHWKSPCAINGWLCDIQYMKILIIYKNKTFDTYTCIVIHKSSWYVSEILIWATKQTFVVGVDRDLNAQNRQSDLRSTLSGTWFSMTCQSSSSRSTHFQDYGLACTNNAKEHFGSYSKHNG